MKKDIILKVIALIQAILVSVGAVVEGQMTIQAAVVAGVSAAVAFVLGLFHTQPGQISAPAKSPPK